MSNKTYIPIASDLNLNGKYQGRNNLSFRAPASETA